MNDIVLSSLIHLFALLGAKRGIDRDRSIELITEYLTRFFGIRNQGHFVRLYTDLRDFYDDDPELDKDSIVEGICTRLEGQITPEVMLTLLLRLMEFCNIADDPIFNAIARIFHVSEEQFSEMQDFITETSGENMLIYPIGDDRLKILRFRDFNMTVVSYMGDLPVWMDDILMIPGLFQTWRQSSVIKGNKIKPIYYSTIMAEFGDGLGAEIEFCGRNVDFRFEPGGENGLHDFSFTLHSGELVAIMGGSGAGKTTTLSILCGTLIPQSGSVTLNGVDINDPQVRKLIGFVPQDDLLFEELTVYENLLFTARLCFDGMSEEELSERVMDILRQLGLEAARDLKVGSPVNKFISGGQRKRLNIALELIREPAVLFLDEPTSGLSSTDTENVINLLKSQTCKGKLVIMNIHQPSSDVFRCFDRLWLLDRGGYPIYDGNPIEAIPYFKTAANFADPSTSACPVCGNVNPEIILNIVDDKLYDNTGELTDKRRVTPQEWNNMYRSALPAMDEPKAGEVPHSEQKKPGRLRQTMIFLHRNIKAKITNLQYLLVTLFEAPILAVICGLLTRFSPDGCYTLMDNKNFPSFIFMAIIVSIFMGMTGSAEEIIKDKAILRREKFMDLSYGSYIWSKIIYMAGVCLIQTLLFTLVGCPLMGVRGMFWEWLLILFMSEFLSALIGLLLSRLMNSVVAIYITIPLLLIPQILLCGLVVHFEDLTPESETGNVPLIGDVIPSRWAYEALSVAQYTMNDYEKEFFDKDRERYEAMYYETVFAHQLEIANERRDEDDKALLANELPFLMQISGLPPYAGTLDYASVDQAVIDARTALKQHYSRVSMDVSKMIDERVRAIGKERLSELKQRNCNTQLENLLINKSAQDLCRVVNGHIVPSSAYVFLTPRGKCGRSQFYSGVKRVGDTVIPTFWFDFAVLVLMCFIIGGLLFVDFDKKIISLQGFSRHK
ncbi:MAG: ATP-binding cassette domain-containing protein [Bacteroidales bacterium]|nr:ATP-binding cassette domain-containing protein [Bacteroidales bacterium]